MRDVKLFLAGPSDCAEERAEALKIIDKLNDGFAKALEIRISVVRFEDEVTPFGKRGQSALNEKANECEIFVLIMFRTWGQEAKDSSFSSYTEEELCLTIRRICDTGWPYLYVFFKDVDIASRRDPGKELAKVMEFQKRVQDSKLLIYGNFGNAAHFATKFERAMEDVAKKLFQKKAPELESEHELKLAAAKLCPGFGEGPPPPPTPVIPDSPTDQQIAANAKKAAAQGHLEKALRLFGLLAERSKDIQALGQAADFYIQNDRYDDAETIVRPILADTADEDPKTYVDFANRLAQILEGRRRFDEALALASQALKIATENGYDDGTCSIYRTLGNISIAQGRLREAAQHHRKSLEIAEQAGSLGAISAACSNLGHVLGRLGQSEEAQQLLERAIKIDLERNNQFKVMAHKINLATVLSRRRDRDRAYSLLREALLFGQQNNDPKITSLAAGNLAAQSIEDGRVAQASEFLNVLMESVSKVDDPEEIARAYSTAAGLYVQTGNLSLAERICLRALETYERLKEPVGMASCYANLATIYAKEGQWLRAKDYSAMALDLFKKIGDLDAIGLQFKNLGIVSDQLGDFDGALMSLRQALVIYEKLENDEHAGQVQMMMAFALMHVGRRTEALELVRNAAQLFKKAGLVDEASNARRMSRRIAKLGSP